MIVCPLGLFGRRTRVVGAFPDGQSDLNLAPARRAPHRRNSVVDQTIFEHGAAEGPADGRIYHRLSQCRVPLSPAKCVKNSGHFPYRRGFIDRQAFAHLAETAVASTYRIYLLRVPRRPIVAA
jgi:hypothetical protein